VPSPQGDRNLDIVGHHQHRAAGVLGRCRPGDRVLDGQTLAGFQTQQGRRPLVGVRCRFGAHHLVAAHADRKIVPSNAVQRTLGQRAPGVGHQSHRNLGIGKNLEQLAGALAPGQAAVEQVGGVVVQPVGAGGHVGGVVVQAEVGVDDPHHPVGRAPDGGVADLGRELTAEALVELLQRDIPELFGVDKGAVHVPQDRSHRTIVPRNRR
jgi:hypothetical protein